MGKITTVKDIEEKGKNEKFFKKLTPEEIKQRRVQVENMELQIRDLEIQNELLKKDIDEQIALKRQRIRIKENQHKIEAMKFDIETINRMIKKSER